MENMSKKYQNVDINVVNKINEGISITDDNTKHCNMDTEHDNQDIPHSDDNKMVIPPSASPESQTDDHDVIHNENFLVTEMNINKDTNNGTPVHVNIAKGNGCDTNMCQQHNEEVKAKSITEFTDACVTQIEIDTVSGAEFENPKCITMEVGNTEKNAFIKVIELTPSGVKLETFCKYAEDDSNLMIDANEKQEHSEIKEQCQTDDTVDKNNQDQESDRKDGVHFSSPLSVVYVYHVSQNTCSQSTQDIADLNALSPDDNIVQVPKISVSNADISCSDSSTSTVEDSLDFDNHGLVTATKVSNIMTPAGDCCNSAIGTNLYVVNGTDIGITPEGASGIVSNDVSLSDIVCINDLPNANHFICKEVNLAPQNDVHKKDELNVSTILTLPANIHVKKVHAEHCNDAEVHQKEPSSVQHIERTLSDFLVKEKFDKVPLKTLEESDVLLSSTLVNDDQFERTTGNSVHHSNLITEQDIDSVTQEKENRNKVTGNVLNTPHNSSQEDLFDSEQEMEIEETDQVPEITHSPATSVEAHSNTLININSDCINGNVHHTNVSMSQNDIFDSDSQNEIRIDESEIISLQFDKCNGNLTCIYVENETPQDTVTCENDVGKQTLSDGTGVLYGGRGGPVKKRVSAVDDTDTEPKKQKLDVGEIPGINTLKRVQPVNENQEQIPFKKIKLVCDKDQPKSLKSIAAHIISTSDDNLIWENNSLLENTEVSPMYELNGSSLNSATVKSEIFQKSIDHIKKVCKDNSDSVNKEGTVVVDAGAVISNKMNVEELTNSKDSKSDVEIRRSNRCTCICETMVIDTNNNYPEVIENSRCIRDILTCENHINVLITEDININNNDCDEMKDEMVVPGVAIYNECVTQVNATSLHSNDANEEIVNIQKVSKTISEIDEEKIVSLPAADIEASPRFITAMEYHSQSQSSQVSSNGFTVDTRTDHQLSSQESCRSIPVVSVGECHLVEETKGNGSECEETKGNDSENAGIGDNKVSFDASHLDAIVDAAVDQVVPGIAATERTSSVDTDVDDCIRDSLYSDDKSEKPKVYTCDLDLCSDDGGRLCQTVDEGSKAKPSAMTTVPSHEKCFKWRYTPSCNLDTEPLPPEDDNQVIRIEPLRTCSKPIRVGLSRRQAVHHLHKFSRS